MFPVKYQALQHKPILYVAFTCMLHLYVCCIYMYVAFTCMLHLYVCCIYMYVAFTCMLHLHVCCIYMYVAFTGKLLNKFILLQPGSRDAAKQWRMSSPQSTDWASCALSELIPAVVLIRGIFYLGLVRVCGDYLLCVDVA